MLTLAHTTHHTNCTWLCKQLATQTTQNHHSEMEAHASLPVMPNGWPGTIVIDLISNSTTVHSCGIVFWGVALNEIHWYGIRGRVALEC